MTPDARQPHAEAKVFAAEITPHRSLGPRGVAIIVGGFAALNLVISIPFFLLGAWPVLGFMGLDVIGLWIAFRYSFAQARACEQVALTYVELLVRKMSPRGVWREWRFNPRWVRLTSETDEDFGMTRVSLAERRQVIDVADALSPAEREEFAAALSRALATARAGPRAPT